MTTITHLTPLDLMLTTDDAGTVAWRENFDLGVMLLTASDRHPGIAGGLTNAEDGLLVIGLGIDGDKLAEVHSWARVGSSSLEAVEAAIGALEVVRDGLRRVGA